MTDKDLSRMQEVFMSSRILDRVAFLLDSKNIESDMKFLVELQKEQAPWLDEKSAYDCAIFSVIKLYGDYELSWLHYNESESEEVLIAA